MSLFRRCPALAYFLLPALLAVGALALAVHAYVPHLRPPLEIGPWRLFCLGYDFPQYYAAGLAVDRRMPDAIYPVADTDLLAPDPAQRRFHQPLSPSAPDLPPPLFANSYLAAPLARALADAAVPPYGPHNVYPPPVAVAVAPLARLPFPAARATFALAMALCAGLFLLLLAAECRAAGLAAWAANAFVLLAAASYPMLLSLKTLNIAPLLMLASAALVRALRTDRPSAVAATAVVLAATKGLSLPLAPLLLVHRRWRTVAWGAALALAVFLATLPLVSLSTYADYLLRVGPAARHLYSLATANILALSARHARSLSPLALDVLQAALLLAIFVLAAFRPKNSATLLDQLGAAMAVFVLFNPVTTQCMLLWPFVPHLLARAKTSRFHAYALPLPAIALLLQLYAPLNASAPALLGTLAFFALGLLPARPKAS